MAYFIKRDLAIIVMALLALVVLIEFFVNIPELTAARSLLTSWASLLASFTIVVGLVGFARYNYHEVQKRGNEWWLKVWTIICMFLVLGVGLATGAGSEIYTWVWYMFNSWPYKVVTVITSLYMMSAAYRAFRVRSVEATILMLGGFLTILGFAPLFARSGGVVADTALWLANVPNAAVVRGVTIGIGIGSAAIGFRILLGKETAMKGEPAMEVGG